MKTGTAQNTPEITDWLQATPGIIDFRTIDSETVEFRYEDRLSFRDIPSGVLLFDDTMSRAVDEPVTPTDDSEFPAVAEVE